MSDYQEKVLKTNQILLTTGFIRFFSDSLNNRFNNLLVAAAGATVNQMGFLQGAKSLSANFTQLLFGNLADRFGKKRFIAAGRLFNAFAITALLVYDTPEHLIWLVILSSFFNSMSKPSWNSLLGDYTDEYNRGKIIGRINSVSQLGSFFAMIVAFILNINQKGDTTPSSFTLVLAVAAATSFLSGLLVYFIDEKPPTGRKRELNLGLLVQDKRLSRYLLLNFVYGMGMSFAWPLFPMVITHRLSMKIWQISTLSIVSSLISSLAQPHLGALMDNVGRRPIIVSSRVLMSVAPLTYALASEWWHIAIGELFLGFGMAAWMSSESTYIIDLAPGDLRATYLASSTAAFGIASFIGSNVGGQIIETYFNGLEGLNQGLFLSAFLRLSFGLAYFTAFESKKDNRES